MVRSSWVITIPAHGGIPRVSPVPRALTKVRYLNREKYEVVRSMFRPDTTGEFDYRPALDATPQSRLVIMAGAMEWILTLAQEDAAKETTGSRRHSC